MGNYSTGIVTKEAILNSCKTLFYEKGITDTTYIDICNAANINRGLIPYHFGSKNNIAAEIYRMLVKNLESQIITFFGELPPMTQLALFMSKTYETVRNNRNVGRFLDEMFTNSCWYDATRFEQRNVIQNLVKNEGLDYSEHQLRTIICMSEGVEREVIHGLYTGYLTDDLWEITLKDVQFVFSALGIPHAKADLALQEAHRMFENSQLTFYQDFSCHFSFR